MGVDCTLFVLAEGTTMGRYEASFDLWRDSDLWETLQALPQARPCPQLCHTAWGEVVVTEDKYGDALERRPVEVLTGLGIADWESGNGSMIEFVRQWYPTQEFVLFWS